MNQGRVAPEPPAGKQTNNKPGGWTAEDTPQDGPPAHSATTDLVHSTSISSPGDDVAVEEELLDLMKDPEVWKPPPAEVTTLATKGGLNSIPERTDSKPSSANVNLYSHKGPPAYDKGCATSKLDHHGSPADSNSSSFDRADSLSKLKHEVGKVTKVFLSTVSRVTVLLLFLVSIMI
jgi:hypothetical protein